MPVAICLGMSGAGGSDARFGGDRPRFGSEWKRLSKFAGVKWG
jgi:hypothetical protein